VAAVDIRRGSFASREKSENQRPRDLLLAVLVSLKTIRWLPGLASCARADSCQCRGSSTTAPMPQNRGYPNCTRRPLGLEVAGEARQPKTLVPPKGTITSLGSRGANCGIFLHFLTDADAIPREPQTNLTVSPDYLLRLTGKVA
jgi:hypothetical protein